MKINNGESFENKEKVSLEEENCQAQQIFVNQNNCQDENSNNFTTATLDFKDLSLGVEGKEINDRTILATIALDRRIESLSDFYQEFSSNFAKLFTFFAFKANSQICFKQNLANLLSTIRELCLDQSIFSLSMEEFLHTISAVSKSKSFESIEKNTEECKRCDDGSCTNCMNYSFGIHKQTSLLEDFTDKLLQLSQESRKSVLIIFREVIPNNSNASTFEIDLFSSPLKQFLNKSEDLRTLAKFYASSLMDEDFSPEIKSQIAKYIACINKYKNYRWRKNLINLPLPDSIEPYLDKKVSLRPFFEAHRAKVRFEKAEGNEVINQEMQLFFDQIDGSHDWKNLKIISKPSSEIEEGEQKMTLKEIISKINSKANLVSQYFIEFSGIEDGKEKMDLDTPIETLIANHPDLESFEDFAKFYSEKIIKLFYLFDLHFSGNNIMMLNTRNQREGVTEFTKHDYLLEAVSKSSFRLQKLQKTLREIITNTFIEMTTSYKAEVVKDCQTYCAFKLLCPTCETHIIEIETMQKVFGHLINFINSKCEENGKGPLTILQDLMPVLNLNFSAENSEEEIAIEDEFPRSFSPLFLEFIEKYKIDQLHKYDESELNKIIVGYFDVFRHSKLTSVRNNSYGQYLDEDIYDILDNLSREEKISFLKLNLMEVSLEAYLELSDVFEEILKNSRYNIRSLSRRKSSKKKNKIDLYAKKISSKKSFDICKSDSELKCEVQNIDLELVSQEDENKEESTPLKKEEPEKTLPSKKKRKSKAISRMGIKVRRSRKSREEEDNLDQENEREIEKIGLSKKEQEEKTQERVRVKIRRREESDISPEENSKVDLELAEDQALEEQELTSTSKVENESVEEKNQLEKEKILRASSLLANLDNFTSKLSKKIEELAPTSNETIKIVEEVIEKISRYSSSYQLILQKTMQASLNFLMPIEDQSALEEKLEEVCYLMKAVESYKSNLLEQISGAESLLSLIPQIKPKKSEIPEEIVNQLSFVFKLFPQKFIEENEDETLQKLVELKKTLDSLREGRAGEKSEDLERNIKNLSQQVEQLKTLQVVVTPVSKDQLKLRYESKVDFDQLEEIAEKKFRSKTLDLIRDNLITNSVEKLAENIQSS